MVEIKGGLIWFMRHVHGQNALALRRRCKAMQPGDVVVLAINGVEGIWERLDHRVDGHPQFALRPLGRARTAWRALHLGRAARVSIELRTWVLSAA